MIPDTILHPRLDSVRCVLRGRRIVIEDVQPGPCGACGNSCTETDRPGERFLVRGYYRDEAGKLLKLPGEHAICHDCLIMWDAADLG